MLQLQRPLMTHPQHLMHPLQPPLPAMALRLLPQQLQQPQLLQQQTVPVVVAAHLAPVTNFILFILSSN